MPKESVDRVVVNCAGAAFIWFLRGRTFQPSRDVELRLQLTFTSDLRRDPWTARKAATDEILMEVSLKEI